jgi:hypothetical protein
MAAMPQLDLSDDDAVTLADLLRETINRQRVFPLPPDVTARGKAILERLEGLLPKGAKRE